MDRLPMQPLLDAIERAGGLHHLFPHDEAAEQHAQHRGASRKRAGNHRDPVAREFRAEFNTLRDYLRKSKARGWIPFDRADDVICRWLRTHPYDVYGEAWYDAA